MNRHSLLLTCIMIALSVGLSSADARRKPRPKKGKPEGAPDYVPTVRKGDGAHLALTMRKLKNGLDPERPFVIWAIGSSFTNKLGRGKDYFEYMKEHFPNGPNEFDYRIQVGNSATWQDSTGWAMHRVSADQPDLVLIYTIGNHRLDVDDLDRLLRVIRQNTTADIIVPSIHWLNRHSDEFEKGEMSARDWNHPKTRAVCEKYGVEYIPIREDWGRYLRENDLPVTSLLADSVHQSDYGRQIVNMSINAHFRTPEAFAYDPDERERRLRPGVEPLSIRKNESVDAGEGWSMKDGKLVSSKKGARLEVTFQGRRLDLIGARAPEGGTADVFIDGKPAGEYPAFIQSYIDQGKDNKRIERYPTRDRSPHGVILGENVVPQEWTITMTDDEGGFKLAGSVTGPDGEGVNTKLWTSDSGQIVVDPYLWRGAGSKRRPTFAGDTFTWTVSRATAPEVSFDGKAGERFRVRLVQSAPNAEHIVTIIPRGDGPVTVEAFDVFEPPLK